MKTFVFDLEANGFLDVATAVHCGVFISLDGQEVHQFYPGSHEDYIKEMLSFMDSADCLIGHNVHGYDFPLLEKLFGYKYKNQKIDTVVMSRLFKPKRNVPWGCPVKNKPHSIETWGYRLGRYKPSYEDWSVFTPEMLHRCTEDTEIGRLVYLELMREKESYNWDNAVWLTGRLFEILGKQEQYGWKVDREWMDFCIHMCTHWIRKIDRVLAYRLPPISVCEEKKVKGELSYVKKPFLKSGQLNQHVLKYLDGDNCNIAGPFSRVSFRAVDPNSRAEAIDYLLSLGWIPSEWNTNDAGERTSPKLSKDDPFEGITDRVGKLFAKRMQVKHRRSNVEGLIKHIREDGRIPSVITNLAETGRATHSKIVNIPNAEAFFGKWMRKIFVADEGKILIGTDSAGCQNRMLAGRVGDPAFTDTLINGKKEDKTSIHFVNQKALKNIAGMDIGYGMCKNLNYGFMFGASDNKLGRMVGGDKDSGGQVRKALLSVSTGFADLVERLTGEWKSNAKVRNNKWGKVEYYDGWVTGLDGRPIFIDSEHKILVYVLQSDEAIMMAAAYVFLYDWLEQDGLEWGKDWAYVGWMHDEYTIEANPEHESRIRFLAEQAITTAGNYFNIQCPHEGESAVGINWYDIH